MCTDSTVVLKHNISAAPYDSVSTALRKLQLRKHTDWRHSTSACGYTQKGRLAKDNNNNSIVQAVSCLYSFLHSHGRTTGLHGRTNEVPRAPGELGEEPPADSENVLGLSNEQALFRRYATPHEGVSRLLLLFAQTGDRLPRGLESICVPA